MRRKREYNRVKHGDVRAVDPVIKAEAKGKKTGEGQNSEGFKCLKVSQMETEGGSRLMQSIMRRRRSDSHAGTRRRTSLRPPHVGFGLWQLIFVGSVIISHGPGSGPDD